jgi:hypothetical protein
MFLEWPSTTIFMLTIHSTSHGSKQVRLYIFACGWNHTWKLNHTHGNKKVRYLNELQIKFRNYINTIRAIRKLGCIHLYVVQIKPKNYINTPWQQENGLDLVHSQLKYQKGMFKFLKTRKDKFGFLFILHYYSCNGFFYANR